VENGPIKSSIYGNVNKNKNADEPADLGEPMFSQTFFFSYSLAFPRNKMSCFFGTVLYFLASGLDVPGYIQCGASPSFDLVFKPIKIHYIIIYMYIYMYVCMYVCIDIYIYVCRCIYIYIYLP
jgi:hypothetical protein